jgi:transposase
MRSATDSSADQKDPSMHHRNAPLSLEGRRRLIARCQTRPIAHVAAEMGISRQCASKWVNRYRHHGEAGLLDRPSVPHHQPTATPAEVVARIEHLRRQRKYSARRIATELAAEGITISVRTVGRHLLQLGLNRRRFLDPTGQNNRQPRRIIARWPGHMVHLDVKKTGQIPDGGGWRVHGKGSTQDRQVARTKTRGQRPRYTYLHSAVDGYSRLAYTEALPDETARTAIGFVHRARAFFARHGITHIHRLVTDNGSCYRAHDFATVRLERPLQLPSTTHCRRRPATSIQAPHRRHQRHGLIQLAVMFGEVGQPGDRRLAAG